jgi:APA family basic amino acid/polyamine antiporter
LASTDELKRQLGLVSATALVVGEVIGVGIFLTPAGMATKLGSPMWLLAVWLGMGAVTLSGALCLAELAARYPAVGGSYVYLREAYGPAVAFLFGWMSLLVLDPGLTAVLATGLASYVQYTVALSPLAGKAVAVAVVLVLAVVNILGVRFGAGLLRWLTVFKLGLLGFIACWGFGWGLGDWSNFLPLVERPAGSMPLGEALAGAVVLAFFSFAGWWDVSRMAGEVENPGRNVPRALVLGVAIVTATYLLVSAVFLYLVPVGQVTTEQAFAAQAGEVLFGRLGAVLFSGVVIVAILGSLASFVMGAPRVYYAMARDGLFLPAIAAVHPRFGTPARAIALQAALASVLVLSGTFDQILAYFFFAVVAFLALTIGAVYVLRWRSPPPADYRIPGYPVTPLLFLIPIAFLLVLLAVASPDRSLLGAGVVLAGIPVYYLIFRRGKSRTEARP